MADLPIPTRQTVPNAITGAKAPYALADTSGQQNFGGAVAQTSINQFDRIISLRAENEYHEFLGASQAAETEFSNYVRNNPGATADQLKTEQSKMIQAIEKAAKVPTTGLARNQAKQSLLSSKDALIAKTNGVVESVILSQQTDKFNLLRDKYITEGNYENLQSLYAGNSGKLFEPETAALMFEQDAMQLQANLQKANEEQGYQIAMQQIDAGLSADEAIEAGKAYIPASSRQEFESEVQAVANRTKEKRVEAFKTDAHTVINAPTDTFLAKWRTERAKIESNPNVDTATKEAELKKGDARMKALMEGDFDPLDNYDAQTFRRLEMSIRTNPNAVKKSDITGANLTPAQMDTLIADLDKHADTSDFDKLTQDNYRRAINSLITKKAFSKNVAKNNELGARALQAFIEYSKEPRTPDEYAKFYNHLTSTTANLSGWARLWAGRDAGELRKAAEMNIADLESGMMDNRVEVVSPDGTTGTIPADQLAEALKSGYKEAK